MPEEVRKEVKKMTSVQLKDHSLVLEIARVEGLLERQWEERSSSYVKFMGDVLVDARNSLAGRDEPKKATALRMLRGFR